MNIKDAKQQIKYTVKAYLKKNDTGMYVYPIMRQRPVLLMGPPGIGKTAVMQQIAEECNIGLVSYTITHHTRQSAVGLPVVKNKQYGEEIFDITEYTMSEIIASVYECMEKTGNKEGILFIDEINCVSETLAPTMLQFLQNKTFGTHSVPDGWIIVAAGNPLKYNKSVKEFDVVTLDRVRKMDIDPDLNVWMEYAWKNDVHATILSYLSMKNDKFYTVEEIAGEKEFVTARGWEDLSEILKAYEEMQLEVDVDLVMQFLQKESTAKDFSDYYRLYKKNKIDYGIASILDPNVHDTRYNKQVEMAKTGGFEERFIVTGLVLDTCNQYLKIYDNYDREVKALFEYLQILKGLIKTVDKTDYLDEFIQMQKNSLRIKQEQGLISIKQLEIGKNALKQLVEYNLQIKEMHLTDMAKAFDYMKEQFKGLIVKRREKAYRLRNSLNQAFTFIHDAFGEEEEMLMFVSNLTLNNMAVSFINEFGCDAYFLYSKEYMYKAKESELQRICRNLSFDGE